MTPEFGNWGRWGEDDERGALNLLTPETVLSALASARAGRVLSLSLPLSARGTPTFPLRPPLLHVMTVDGGDYAAGAPRGPNGFQFSDDYIGIAGHAGTHVDALSHVAQDGIMYNGFAATEVRSRTGARRLSIERFGGLVGRALLLDVAASTGVASLPADYEIDVPDLQAALDAAGTEIRPGDSILLRTGWLDRFVDGDTAWYEAEPGIGVAGARWLAQRDVVLIGADNWAVELAPSPDGDTMPVHLVCLREHGIHLMELVNLAPLVAAGASECLLIVAPLPIRGGVGCPVNPIAVC